MTASVVNQILVNLLLCRVSPFNQSCFQTSLLYTDLDRKRRRRGASESDLGSDHSPPRNHRRGRGRSDSLASNAGRRRHGSASVSPSAASRSTRGARGRKTDRRGDKRPCVRFGGMGPRPRTASPGCRKRSAWRPALGCRQWPQAQGQHIVTRACCRFGATLGPIVHELSCACATAWYMRVHYYMISTGSGA